MQIEADKVKLLTEELELSQKEKTDLSAGLNQLKEKIEEIKHSFQLEISQMQDAHRSEMEALGKKKNSNSL